MGTGYVRNDVGNNIADGNVINASDLDGEFDAVQAAFNGSTGHSHDGTTGEGPQIDTAGIANDAVDATKLDETDSYTVAGLSVTGNTTLGDAATDTVTFTADVASNILPNADGTLSLGASGSSWGDAYVTSLYLGGTAVTSTAAELNILDGVTSTTAELNILDGVTSTSSELNLVDGSTAGTVVNSKAVIYGASGEVNATTLQVGGVAITATPAEINTLDGITASTAELNILDGVTSTSSELNLVDGSVAGTVTNSKAVIYGASGEVNATTLQVGGVAITATPAELNILDGVTSTSSELNLVDGSSAGTVVNSKAVIYGASGEVNATTLQIGGSSITSTAAELNILDGVTATTAELNILDGVTADATELNILDGVTATTAELNYLDIATLGTSAASKAITADSDNETLISGAVRGTVTSVSSSSNVTTYDMNTTNNFSTTTTETTDITFSNETAGQSGNILFVNAGHVVSIDADVHMSTADLNAINVTGTYLIGYYCPDGTNVYMSATPALVEGS